MHAGRSVIYPIIPSASLRSDLDSKSIASNDNQDIEFLYDIVLPLSLSLSLSLSLGNIVLAYPLDQR